MKISKIFICILLVLCMMLSLCACAGDEKDSKSNDSDKETKETEKESEKETEEELTLAEQLVGTWDLELDVTEMLIDELSSGFEMDMDEYASDLEMVFYMTFEFDEDGDCKLYFDEDMLADSMDDFVDDLCPIMAEVTYDMLEESDGYSKDDCDELFEIQYGMGVEEYYSEMFAESLTVENLFGEMTSIDGTYELDGNELSIGVDGEYNGDAAEISIDGDTLTIDGAVDESLEETLETLGLDLPWILERR